MTLFFSLSFAFFYSTENKLLPGASIFILCWLSKHRCENVTLFDTTWGLSFNLLVIIRSVTHIHKSYDDVMLKKRRTPCVTQEECGGKLIETRDQKGWGTVRTKEVRKWDEGPNPGIHTLISES